MLKNMLIVAAFLLVTNIAFANPISENPNFNVTSLDKILNLEKGVVTTSTAWSPDGQYLLVTCSKWVPPSKNRFFAVLCGLKIIAQLGSS